MEECNILVVEGGPKAQKRYRKLLMQRIDWAEVMEEDEEEEEEEEDAGDRAEARRRAAAAACKLVWEGLVVKSQFRSFRVESKGLEGARRLLKEKGCEHYLDMALRFGSEEFDDEEEDSDDSEEEGGGGGGGEEEGGEEGGGMEVDGEE